MKLSELDAHFIKATPTGSRCVDLLSEADGIIFLCPKCFTKNQVDGGLGPMGCHSVICWFDDKVPDSLDPKPGRWKLSGTGLDDLTFVPGNNPAVSVELTGPGCGWHGHVRNGEATLS